jgi:Flp pilus assembly protein TadD
MTSEELVGRTIANGKYQIVRLLGEGGMGAVYQARQVAMDRMVALKLILAELVKSPAAAARFHREMKLTARIEHPNTIRVYDFGETDGQLFLTMELLRGRTLTDVLAESRLELPRIVRIATQICRALQAAHAEGVVHRDLKPDNVMLLEQYGERDVVKVLDFGIAKSLDQQEAGMTTVGGIVGTPIYMSAEQALGAPVDQRSDLYSLGIMLYEMASGRVPFTAPTFPGLIVAHASEIPPSLAQIAPGVHPGLAALVDELLRKDPAARPPTAKVVELRLEALLGGPMVGSTMGAPMVSMGPPMVALPASPMVNAPTGPVVGQPRGPMVSAPMGPRVGAMATPPMASPVGPTVSAPIGPMVNPPMGQQGPMMGPMGSAPMMGHVVVGPPAGTRPGAGGVPGPLAGTQPGAGGVATTLPSMAPPKPQSRKIWLFLGAIVLVGGGAGATVLAFRDHTPAQPAPTTQTEPTPPPTTGPTAKDPAARLAAAKAKLAGFGDPAPPDACPTAAAADAAELVLEARQRIKSDPAGSLEAADKALRACPSAAAAHHIRGNALQTTGKLDEASDAYARALQFAPEYAAPRFNLGVIQLRRRDPAAIATFTEVLRRTPDDPAAYQARGQAHANAERFDEAIADLEEAVRRKPDDGRAWFVLGDVRARVKKGDANEAYCKAAMLGVSDAAARCKK